MDQFPRTALELMRNPQQLRDLLSFLAALQRLRVVTPTGDQPLLHQKGSVNTVIDLRNINANGQSEEPVATGGDVFGPDSSVEGHIPEFDDATGKRLRDSGYSIADLLAETSDYFTNVTRVAAFSVASTSASFTAVPFDTEVSNAFGIWTSGAATRLTAPVAGRYMVSGWLRFAASTTGSRGNFLRTNAQAISITTCAANATPGDGTYLGNAGVVDLDAGEYVELSCYQTSGGALDVVDAQLRLVLINVRTVTTGGGGDSFDVSKIVVSGGSVVCSNGEVVTSGA